MYWNFSKFYLLRTKGAHLNTVISERMKATKEEMFLNLHPILVGISKVRGQIRLKVIFRR